jgi:hypothetical protein
MVRKLGEFPKFLVFSSMAESDQNSPVFAFSLLLFAFIHISVFNFPMCFFGVSNVFMSVFLDEHGRLTPLLPRRGWETLFHGPALPGVPASAIQHTPLSQLRQGSSYLPLPLVCG